MLSPWTSPTVIFIAQLPTTPAHSVWTSRTRSIVDACTHFLRQLLLILQRPRPLHLPHPSQLLFQCHLHHLHHFLSNCYVDLLTSGQWFVCVLNGLLAGFYASILDVFTILQFLYPFVLSPVIIAFVFYLQ